MPFFSATEFFSEFVTNVFLFLKFQIDYCCYLKFISFPFFPFSAIFLVCLICQSRCFYSFDPLTLFAVSTTIKQETLN